MSVCICVVAIMEYMRGERDLERKKKKLNQ
jgi:hypothetical protein